MTQRPRNLHEMSTESAQTPLLAEGRNLILTEEVELPRAERPRDQSIAAVAAWIVDEARRLPSAARFVDEFAWRMLAIPADMFGQRAIEENVLKAYIRQTTGPRVLAGQIRRGAGEEIKAILWSSNLRGFTQLTDRLSGDRIITMLNTVFDAQAIAIESHGGEILKFIGDGLPAIFPITDEAEEKSAAERVLSAAGEAFAQCATLSPRRCPHGRRAALRDCHLRQYRRRRAARFHRDRPRGQPRQPGRDRGEGSRFADRGQRGVRSRLWRRSALARPA
jgi:class 3 adenylate cyclase